MHLKNNLDNPRKNQLGSIKHPQIELNKLAKLKLSLTDSKFYYERFNIQYKTEY